MPYHPRHQPNQHQDAHDGIYNPAGTVVSGQQHQLVPSACCHPSDPRYRNHRPPKDFCSYEPCDILDRRSTCCDLLFGQQHFDAVVDAVADVVVDVDVEDDVDFGGREGGAVADLILRNISKRSNNTEPYSILHTRLCVTLL